MALSPSPPPPSPPPAPPFHSVAAKFAKVDHAIIDGSSCLYGSEGQSASLPTGSSPFTIDFWIKPDTEVMAYGGGIVGWGDYSTDLGSNYVRMSNLCCIPVSLTLIYICM